MTDADEPNQVITDSQMAAARLLLTLDRIEGPITPPWIRDIAHTTSLQTVQPPGC